MEQHNAARRFKSALAQLSIPSVFISVILIASRAFGAASLAITQPAAGQSVSGVYNFAVSAPRLPSLASVEYDLGSKRVGIAVAAPFSVTWNTGYASDGSYALQVTGRDAMGNAIATAQQIFTINNHANSLAVTSPDLGQTLSGVVHLTLSGFDSQYYPALWMVNVDGEDQGDWWSDNLGQSMASMNVQIDTTRFPNGPHELYIAMHSNFFAAANPSDKTWYNWRAAFERVINVDNGHALMDIAANYLHVYLQPGRQVALSCQRLFTDNTSSSCVAPSYSSDNPSLVSVSPAGVASAGQGEGFANVAVSDGGRSTAVRVWVRNGAYLPHFSGDGRMLTSYQNGSSLFVISPFILQPSDLEADAGLLDQVRTAGVNTLSRGFYVNPRDINFDYDTWQADYDATIAMDWQFAANNGFHILATGDEVARNIGSEAWWTLNWPSGQRAVQYAMESFARSGIGVAVDMIDEASTLWGQTPTPPGPIGGPGSFTSISCSGSSCTMAWPSNPVNSSRFPSGVNFALAGSANSSLNTPHGQLFTATNITSGSFDFTPSGPISGTFNAGNDPGLQFLWWAGNIGGCPTMPCDPPVPNNALSTIANWIRTAPASVPISWPPLGVASAQVQAAWLGPNSLSDYASHYWDTFKLRRTYTWSAGIQEQAYWMTNAFYTRQPLMTIDRPQLLLDSISAPAYTKNTPGAAYYTPPGDVLDQPGVQGSVVTSSIMTAAAVGAAGVRLYQWEPPANAPGRAAAPVGSYFQTGANPTAADPIVTGNWQGISYAASLLTNVLTPYILGIPLNSPAYGRNIVTAARQSNSSRMLMIVNDNDWQRTIAVDFSPYRFGGQISRYLVGSDGIATSESGDSSGETVTLAAGQSAVYLFHPARAVEAVHRVKIHRPRFSGTDAILHYDYINWHSPGVPVGIKCGKGCSIELDPNLGRVYYQLTYLGSHQRVKGRSAIQQLKPAL